MSTLAVGDILDGRYRIDRPIARGGMSTVYRCVDLRLGRAVAAKVMHEHLAGDPIFQQRFRREARAMAQLSHPNLVAIHDFSADGDPVFLIMELITGGTLRELLAERGPMPPHAATAVLRAVLTGLSAVHARGLVHRDIKPDNVLINADHRVKLGDFGLVRSSNAQATNDHIVGTVSYLAPEQVTGEDITPATDVYSAGIVAYELLTGDVPFSGDTPIAHATSRLNADVPAPSSHIDGIPPLFDALVASATARAPEERFTDAAEFLAALDDVAASLELPAFTVPVPQNSAAARTAAQPTDFTGVRSDDVFEPTRTLPADATEVIGNPAEDPTTVMAPEPLPEDERPRLSFETKLDMPTQHPVAAPVEAPLPQPTFNTLARTPSYEATARREPEEVATAVEEPAPQVYSNRSGVVFGLWLAAVALAALAVGVGGWWFGSGDYGAIPVFWWPM